MPIYKYTALNEKSRKIKGEVLAANDIDLEERLKSIGLDVIDYNQAKVRSKRVFGRVKHKDLILLCLHLEQLERAGVPLLDALADVRDATEVTALRDVMTDVYESVKNGEMLSEAMSKHPIIFNSVFIGLVKAGEKTGNLAESFHELSKHIKWVLEIRSKVSKALGYPITLLFVITAVISVLMIYVVPKLTDFIIAQGFELPFHTRALMAFSSAFSNYWYLIFGVPTILTIAVIILKRTSENFAYNFDAFMLKLPVIGSTLRKLDLARFTHFFSVMFKSGIEILEALDTAKSVVVNKVLQESVVMVRRYVSEGNSVTNALRISSQFPNLVVRMFKVGEDSGNMNEALDNVNFFYDREVNDSVDKMVGMIQPALTIVLGMMILWIVSAVFGPLYDSFSKIKF